MRQRHLVVLLLVWVQRSSLAFGEKTFAPVAQDLSAPLGRKLMQNGPYVYISSINEGVMDRLRQTPVDQPSTSEAGPGEWFLLSPANETPLGVQDASNSSLANLDKIAEYLDSSHDQSRQSSEPYVLDRDYLISGSSVGRVLPTVFAPNYLNIRVLITARNDTSNGTAAPSTAGTTILFSNVTLWLPHVDGSLEDNVTLTAPDNQDWVMDGSSRTCFINSTVVAKKCGVFTDNSFLVLCFTANGMAGSIGTSQYFNEFYHLPKDQMNIIQCIPMVAGGSKSSGNGSSLSRLWLIWLLLPVVIALAALAACLYVRHRRYEKSMTSRLAESEAKAKNYDLLHFDPSNSHDDSMVAVGGKWAHHLQVTSMSKRPPPKIIDASKLEDLSALQHQLQSVIKSNPSDEAHITVEAEIGRGAYGVVYKGLWKNMRVAIKTILFQASQDIMNEPVIREASIALRVSHENLVATYHADVRQLQGNGQQLGTACQMYLIQEFCDAGTLYSALSQSRFHVRDVADKAIIVRCILDIALGIAALHQCDIIHGDLKPQNVLLASRPPDKGVGRVEPRHWRNVAKLTDFGLSFCLDSKSHLSNLHVGTPFYLAPEVQSTGHLSKASDVYSLGVLMWEMYHGTPPYLTQNGRLVHNTSFPRFTSTSAPFSFAVLTLACLSKDHQDRPSIQEVVTVMEDLNQAINSGDAMLAISADVPALLMRLMHSSGLARDPAFYNLIQKADTSKLKVATPQPTDAQNGKDGKAVEVGQDSGVTSQQTQLKVATGDAAQSDANVEPEALQAPAPLLSCHDGMIPISNALLVDAEGKPNASNGKMDSWPVVDQEDIPDRVTSAEASNSS